MRPLITFIIALVASSCSPPEEPPASVPASAPEITFRDDGTLEVLRNGQILRTLSIEIADTDEDRQKGMMERTSLPADTGMLFLME